MLARPAKKIKSVPEYEKRPTSLPPSGLAMLNKSNRVTKAPRRSTKAACQLMETPAPASVDTTPQGSVTSSSTTKCPATADLPVDLLINGRWQNDIMPTLLLWAGGNSDVWGVSRGSVTYALPLIVDFHPDGLDSSTMDFSWYSPSVSVVCPWTIPSRQVTDGHE